jgi:hypothetical protein
MKQGLSKNMAAPIPTQRTCSITRLVISQVLQFLAPALRFGAAKLRFSTEVVQKLKFLNNSNLF